MFTNTVSWFYSHGLFHCLFAARLFHQAFISFRKYIMESSSVSADLHIILNDICCGAGKYLGCLENKMCIFLLFLTAVLTCLPVGPPLRCCKRGRKSFCFLFRTICAHPTEFSVFESPEVVTKEVEVLASRSPLFYSICSLVKRKLCCLIYSSLKNLVVTRGHFESVVLPRWLEKLGNIVTVSASVWH